MTSTVLVRNELHDGGSRSGQWAVVVDGTIVSRHRKKSRALEEARQQGRQHAPAVLRVQDTNGQWSTEASYR